MDFRSGPFRAVLITTAVAVAGVLLLYHWLLPDHGSYKAAPWLAQVVVTLLGLVGASWFAYRRLELLEQSNRQRRHAADEQLAATERGNLNDAIKEADGMMSKPSLSSIIAGQRWLHHLAEDERLDAGLIRSLLCAHIASTASAPTSRGTDTDDSLTSDEVKQIKHRARQMALEMLFAAPSRDRYSHCRDTPELGSCIWRYHDFSNLHVENVNFRKGNFTNAQISGTFFDGSDLRETVWSGGFGGRARTSMRGVKMCGAQASSCVFTNIDFNEANMGNNGLATRFTHCTFRHCDFTGAIWSGAEFDTPNFEGCTGITYDLCQNAKLKNPSGLPEDMRGELERMGVGGY